MKYITFILLPLVFLCYECPFQQTKPNECTLISSICSIYGYYYYHKNEIPKLKLLTEEGNQYLRSHLQKYAPFIPLNDSPANKKKKVNVISSELSLKQQKLNELIEAKMPKQISEENEMSDLEKTLKAVYEIMSTLKTQYDIESLDYIETIGNIFEFSLINASNLSQCKTIDNVCMFIMECGIGKGDDRKKLMNLSKKLGNDDSFIPLYDLRYFKIQSIINHFMFSKLDDLVENLPYQLNAFDPENGSKTIFTLNKNHVLVIEELNEDEDCVISDIYLYKKN